MNEIEVRALGKYARLRPEDRERTTVYVSEETLKTVARDNPAASAIPLTLFGMPLKIDDAVPYGDWRFMVEVK